MHSDYKQWAYGVPMVRQKERRKVQAKVAYNAVS